MQECKDNNSIYFFMQIPTLRHSINRIYLGSNQSIMKNIHQPKVHVNSTLSIITPKDSIKNALMLGLDVVLIWVNHIYEDINKIKYNYIYNGYKLINNIKALAKEYKKVNNNIYILIYKEFKDGFLLYATLITKDGLMLHTFILQLVDSTIDNRIYMYPVALGHKGKDNAITKNTYIEYINKLEDPNYSIKVYSKIHYTYIRIIL